MKIKFSQQFQKQRDKAPTKIQKALDARIGLFQRDVRYSLLSDHPLQGSLASYRSINITGDWRVLYRITGIGHQPVAIFVMLGTHSQLYGK